MSVKYVSHNDTESPILRVYDVYKKNITIDPFFFFLNQKNYFYILILFFDLAWKEKINVPIMYQTYIFSQCQ